MPRIPIRPFFAALILSATAAGALTWRADAVFAAQPHPAPAPQPVAAATAPAIQPRILARPSAYLAPPAALRRPHVRVTHKPHHQSTAPRAIGRRLAAARGWTGRQWTCLDNLWTRESGWKVHSENSSSGAYGIPQALPARKMASAGSDWRVNAVTQIRWGLVYIAAVYGAPCGAWQHSQDYNYY